MPGQTDAIQGEVTAFTRREPRRSEAMMPSNCKLGTTATRAPRSSVHSASENVAIPGNRRHSPRLAAAAAGPTPKTVLTRGPAARPALLDMTNNALRTHPAQPYKTTTPASTMQTSAFAPSSVAPLVPILTPPSKPAPATPPGIDSTLFQASSEDPQEVPEYVAEICDSLFKEETVCLPDPNYMNFQTDINGKMRAILVDWLIEVHMKYKLRPETLFLTVNLIDRYLSKAHVARKKLQLVGVVSMFIAAKFEEIHPPEVKDFVHITDNAYTKDEVINMECTMLTALNFQIVVPTMALFFEQLQKVNRCDETHRQVTEYILELGLLDMRMLRYTASHAVSAALLLSNELMGRRPVWPQHMVKHSRQTEQALRACMEEYREMLDGSPKAQLQAVRKKFSMPQRQGVARMNF